MFLIVSQVMKTITTATVTVVCSRVVPITMTVTLAPNSVGQTALSQHDVILLPHLIPRNTMRVFVGLTTVLQQQKPQYQMPSQVYGSSAGP